MYQEDRLKQFLNKDTGMKILIQADIIITSEADIYDEGNQVRKVIQFKNRRFEVLNTDDITDVMTKMAEDIETQAGNSHLTSSDIVINKMSKLTTKYDKSNPTRAGSYIELPKWLSSNKACIHINNEDNKCFKYCVQCSVCKTYEKDNPEIMRHYKKLKGIIIYWRCMEFTCSRKYINRFEEESQGLISVNVYALFHWHNSYT